MNYNNVNQENANPGSCHRYGEYTGMRIAALMSFLIILFSCSGKGQESTGYKDTEQYLNTVQSNDNAHRDNASIIKVFRTTITQILEENGELAAGKIASVKSKISGRVLEILVQDGDSVEKGDMIASIAPDLEQMKSISALLIGFKQKEISYNNLKDEYILNKGFLERGFISAAEFNELEKEFIIAEMEYKSGLEEYLFLKNEIGDNVELYSKKLSIISPIAGILMETGVEEGELISGESEVKTGTSLFTIADLSRLIVKININEVDIYQIQKGNRVEITIPANPSITYTGVISKINPFAIDVDDIKVFPVEISINEKDEKLKPGMSAGVKIIIKEKQDTLAIPVTALFIENNREYVFIPGKEGGISKLFITRGINDTENVEVLDILEEGDEVYSSVPEIFFDAIEMTIPAYEMRDNT